MTGGGTGQGLQHGGDCDGCHCTQILAAYCHYFQQRVFWGPTNVSAPLWFGCAGGIALALHFPSLAKDTHKLEAFTAARAYVEEGGDLGCCGGLCPAQGASSGLVWAPQSVIALGFFGTCEGPEAWVEMLLCCTALLGVPRCSWGIGSSVIP